MRKIFSSLRLFALLAVYSLSASAATEDSNYAHLWSGIKNQSFIGSCHSFAVNGLVEAKYAQDFGATIQLSAADLFLHHYLGVTRAIAEDKIQVIFYSTLFSDNGRVERNFEGGSLPEDFTILQQIGLKPDSRLPYRSAELLIGDLQGQMDRLRHEQKRDSKKFVQSIQSSMREFMGRAENILGLTYDGSQNLFEDDQWLRGLHLQTRLLVGSLEQKRQPVFAALACGPVAVELNKSFYHTSSPHVVIVAGYSSRKNTFLVRNSWGRANLFRAYEEQNADRFLAQSTAMHSLAGAADNCH